ncbi:MAG: class I SAM-dependent methyltransferase [Methanobacterium formicicum]
MKKIENTKDDFEKEGKMFHHINSMYRDSEGYENYWQNRRKDLILDSLRDLKNKCDSLLDVGCAEGFFVEKSDSMDYYSVGCDISHSKLIKSAHLNIVECDAQKLPFKSNSFDIVLLNRILELIPDDEKALKEATRVGKKYLIITVPNQYPSILSKISSKLKKGNQFFIYEWGVKARSYSSNHLKNILREYGSVITMKTIAPLGHAFLTPNNKINKIIFDFPIRYHELIDNKVENWLPFNFGHDIICILQLNE